MSWTFYITLAVGILLTVCLISFCFQYYLVNALETSIEQGISNVDKNRSPPLAQIVLNPVAGNGRGRSEFSVIEKKISKIMKFSTYTTKCGGITSDICNLLDKCITGGVPLVVGGGDGMLSEIVNGLMSLSDKCADKSSFKNFPGIAIIPFGTGNGVSKSLGIDNIGDSISALLNGHTKRCDIINVNISFRPQEQGVVNHDIISNTTNYKSILSIAWGAIADYDRLAENDFRWMGSFLKSMLIPLYIISKANIYDGIFWYIDESDGQRKEIPGPFFVVHICNMPYMAKDVKMAPDCTPNDGYMHVAVMRKSGRLQYLRAFLDFETGAHVNHDGIIMIRCKQCGIIPSVAYINENDGCFVIDGNLVRVDHACSLTANVVPATVPMYYVKK